MASNYARGRRLEQRVIDGMRAAGHYVMRSAGSKGEADVLVLRSGRGWPHVIMISCKLGKGGAPPGERIALREAADKCPESQPMPVLAWQKGPRQPIEWYEIKAGGELHPRGDLLKCWGAP